MQGGRFNAGALLASRNDSQPDDVMEGSHTFSPPAESPRSGPFAAHTWSLLNGAWSHTQAVSQTVSSDGGFNRAEARSTPLMVSEGLQNIYQPPFQLQVARGIVLQYLADGTGECTAAAAGGKQLFELHRRCDVDAAAVISGLAAAAASPESDTSSAAPFLQEH